MVKEYRSENVKSDVIFLYVEAWWYCCRPSWKFRWGYLPHPYSCQNFGCSLCSI